MRGVVILVPGLGASGAPWLSGAVTDQFLKRSLSRWGFVRFAQARVRARLCVSPRSPRAPHARIDPPLALWSLRARAGRTRTASYTTFFSLPRPSALRAQTLFPHISIMPKRGGAGSRRSPSPSGSDDSSASAGGASKVARSASGASGGFRKPAGARAPSARKKAQTAVFVAEEAHRKSVLASNDAIKARDLAFGELNTALGSKLVSETIATAFTGATIGVAYDRALLLGTAVRQLAEQIKAKRTMLEAKDTVTGAQVSARGLPTLLPPPSFTHAPLLLRVIRLPSTR